MGSAAMATNTYAHSYVDESIPADGETVEEPVETLTLHFDAGIEPATTVTITDQDGEEFAVQDENVEGDDSSLSLKSLFQVAITTSSGKHSELTVTALKVNLISLLMHLKRKSLKKKKSQKKMQLRKTQLKKPLKKTML